MNTFYRVINASVGTIFAAIMGYAVYNQAPQIWSDIDNTTFLSLVVTALVGVLALGFATLETRKA